MFIFSSFYIQLLFSPAYTRTLMARLLTTAIKGEKNTIVLLINGIQVTKVELINCTVSLLTVHNGRGG